QVCLRRAHPIIAVFLAHTRPTCANRYDTITAALRSNQLHRAAAAPRIDQVTAAVSPRARYGSISTAADRRTAGMDHLKIARWSNFAIAVVVGEKSLREITELSIAQRSAAAFRRSPAGRDRAALPPERTFLSPLVDEERRNGHTLLPTAAATLRFIVFVFRCGGGRK
ncbi:hypothetical protein AAVH_34915, partial [Aphelenchoides avenae]